MTDTESRLSYSSLRNKGVACDSAQSGERESDNVRRRIHAYLHENLLDMRPGLQVGDRDPLLAQGIIDSVGVAELVVFLESEFQLAIADEEITEENFGTVADIERFISNKRDSTHGGSRLSRG